MTAIQTAFQAEPLDNSWATSTSSAVLEATRDNDSMRRAVRRVECRSKSCVVEFTLDSAQNQEALRSFLNRIAAVLPTAQFDHPLLRSSPAEQCTDTDAASHGQQGCTLVRASRGASVFRSLPRLTSQSVLSRRVPSYQQASPSCHNCNGFGRFELFLREKRLHPQQGSNLRPWL